MNDCCIVGGGIIGLSLARVLASRGLSVRVVARSRGDGTASWAAAGIFPPAPAWPGCPPSDALTAWSDRLHREWAAELLDETGIDNGLAAVGGLHLARYPEAMEKLRRDAERWRERGAASALLDRDGVLAAEPALAEGRDAGAILGGMILPDEMQIRPSRHLDALEASCRRRGVVLDDAEVLDFVRRGSAIDRLVTSVGDVAAGSFVLAAGAWTGSMLARFGIGLDTRPIRGQIVLLRLPRPLLSRIVNRGLDYLVQRPDGRLLVGSTIEDVGFDAVTTPDTVARLGDVALSLLGDAARRASVERQWAGLRPGSADGAPTIGRLPGLENAYVSAGHFRAGLHQSTGSAVLLADILTHRRPDLDPAPFAPGRPGPDPGAAPAGSTADYLARAATPS